MNRLADLFAAVAVGFLAAVVADALGAYGEQVTMPDGTSVRVWLTDSDVAALLGGAR